MAIGNIIGDFFQKQERKYAILYRDEMGDLKFRFESMAGGLKAVIKKYSESKDKVFIRGESIDSLRKRAARAKWSKRKLHDFTNYYSVELERAMLSGDPVRQMVLQRVLVHMFDPVVYMIYYLFSEGHPLISEKSSPAPSEKGALDHFPKIFDGYYLAVLRSYLGSSEGGAREELLGFKKLEESIRNEISYRDKIISSSRSSLVTLISSVLMLFVMDSNGYANISEQYGQYGKLPPSFTETVHLFLHGMIINTGAVLIFIALSITIYAMLFENWRFRVFLGEIILNIPVVGSLIKKRAAYIFCDIYATLKMAKSSSMSDAELYNIVAESVSNDYIGGVIRQCSVKMKTEGKNFGVELGKYRIFTDDDEDIIKTFSQEGVGGEQIAVEKLKEMKKMDLDRKADAFPEAIKYVAMILSAILFLVGTYAYYMPTLEQGKIMKEYQRQYN